MDAFKAVPESDDTAGDAIGPTEKMSIAGESSPIDDTEDVLRKRSASPSEASWVQPSKKFCTDAVNVDEWVNTTSDATLPDVTLMYRENHGILIQMGFELEEIDLALRLANNELEKSVQYLTRELAGLDNSKASSSTSAPVPQCDNNRSLFNALVPEAMVNQIYVESDEGEENDNDIVWNLEDVKRVRALLEKYKRYIFYRKNGSLSRCLTAARNILIQKAEGWSECVNFVDEILYFVITRHVNPTEFVFIGDQELGLIEELYHAVIPVLCLRLKYSPINVKICLIVDEMFNCRNKFFTASSALMNNERIFHPPNWCDLSLIDKLENKELYAELIDEFVQTIIPCVDNRLELSPDDTFTFQDLLFLLRSLNTVTGFIEKANIGFLDKVEYWVTQALRRIGTVTDKEIRDSTVRRQGMEILSEVVIMCERFQFDVFAHTQEARMEFLKRWIKCPQIECQLSAYDELGRLASQVTRTRPRVHVSESYLKRWLNDNKVLQVLLTGNMDSPVYVEKITPLLQFMTPEMTFEDLKFVWSLRKGRMGVSFENFNKIMNLFVKSLNSDQIEWLIELFKKSFRTRESRMFESIYNFCHFLAIQQDRNDEIKLRMCNTIWELIAISRGPPLSCPTKSIELGIRKHCDLLNSMSEKHERDTFVMNIIERMQYDDGFNEINVVYLNIMLEKLKRIYVPKRTIDRTEELTLKASRLRENLRNMRLFDNLFDRLENVRRIAHEAFDSSLLNQLIAQGNDSMSNAVFESTSDPFGINIDNILTVPIYGCSDYGFIMQNTLKLMCWLSDNYATEISIDFIERLFEVFINPTDATENEKTEIFNWLTELKIEVMPEEVSRRVLSLLCDLDVNNVHISALQCFSKYLEDMPITTNENDHTPIEGHIMQTMNDCKFLLWKLILFNEAEDVVTKCIETFCEREVISVDSPKYLKLNTLHFLSIFAYYMDQLKAELFKRAGKPNPPSTYDKKEIDINDEEVKQYEIPLDEKLTETVSRAIDRLIRFLTRFIEHGNEKNNMIRQFPSHSSSISGHTVTISIELKSDEEGAADLSSWKRMVCDSSSTIGELKIRLAKRLYFHETICDFSVHRREDDLTMQETPLKYDYMTLQAAKLASETDSIFLSEKIRILVKQRRTTNRKTEKAIHELFLPAAIVSNCNFYDLLHDLSSIGDKRIRSSCRKLLLLLPTQPSLLKKLTYDIQNECELSEQCEKLYHEMIDLNDPCRMLYCLEAISSIICSTKCTPTSCDDANELATALLKTNTPHRIPLNKCSQKDRHSIFERIVQILRAIYVARSGMTKTIANEKLVRLDMQKTAEQLSKCRQVPRSIDECVDFILVRQDTLPEDFAYVIKRNNPSLLFNNTVYSFVLMSQFDLQSWDSNRIVEIVGTLRDFVWIHVATECATSKNVITKETKDNEKDAIFASQLIQSTTTIKNDRWEDEAKLVIVKKVLSTIRHIVCEWVKLKGQEETNIVVLLCNMFMASDWTSFFGDVLVNSTQEGYRKYVQEMLVKMTKENNQIMCMVLKMLFDLYTKLPLKKEHTADLNDLQRRQRLNCDGLIQTICEIFLNEKNIYRKTFQPREDVDWSRVGYSAITIVTEQIKSLMDYNPRFSTLSFELQKTEISYASAKMKLITCLLPYCTQEQIENISTDFLTTVIKKFLFPEQPDIKEFLFEEESRRWENYCRESAICAINMFCERSYKNMYHVFALMEPILTAHKTYDFTYRQITRSKAYDQVGLKNDGGTCYMNATIQQLVHVPGLAQKLISFKNIDPSLKWDENRAALLVELQKVFAQLTFSRAQACVPSGLWREFRFEPDIDVTMLSRNSNFLHFFQDKFFGKYSYEKICYGCWHRYKSPDEEFNCISLALNGDNLEEAFENFLEAHVMEGENAYHCEKCDEKKTTLNRTSFLELPTTMTIQLKRFTYDMVNNVIKKDNQFFKFPFEIDMLPYMTSSRHVADEHVQDLFDDMLYVENELPTTPPHKNEKGEKHPAMEPSSASLPANESPQKKLFRRHRSSTLRLSQSFASSSIDLAPPPPPKPIIYELVGVLAHSGIATAGHYYSFVKERREEMRDSPSYGKWYHMNDALATPMNLSTISETWFGGNFSSDTNTNDERIRHWNAYVLYYEKKVENKEVVPMEVEYQKVTFDITDESPVIPTSPKKEISEARKLRMKMFDDLDERLKYFLNEDNCRFLSDRDFFSFDLYHIYVNSCLQLLKRDDAVEYNVDELSKSMFHKIAFMNCFIYISKMAWQLFEDIRPKAFPKNTIELLKLLMAGNSDNKMIFMSSLEGNDMDLMNRLIDQSEQDIRHAFWSCLKYAMKSWCYAMGNSPNNSTSDGLKFEPSPDSTDLEDDEEDEDEEDEEEEDEDLDDEDTESENDINRIGSGDAMITTRRLVSTPTQQHAMEIAKLKAVVNSQKNVLENQKSPVEGATADMGDFMPYRMFDNSNLTQKNIIRRACVVLQMNRLESSNRHFARHAVDFLLAIARANSFGNTLLLTCGALPCVTDFMFEDHQNIFTHLRFADTRLRQISLWPSLPSLYFELLHAHLDRLQASYLDNHMSPCHILDMLQLYCSARDDMSNTDKKLTCENVGKFWSTRIVDCFTTQISSLDVPESQDRCNEYVSQVVYTGLKEMCVSGSFQEEQWSNVVFFYVHIAHNLYDFGNVRVAVKIIKELLHVDSMGEQSVQGGILLEIMKWTRFDPTRAKKMYDALYWLRLIDKPPFVRALRILNRKYQNYIYPGLINNIDSANPDEQMDEDEEIEEGEEQEENEILENIRLSNQDDSIDLMIGPQPLKRSWNSTDLTNSAGDVPIATARVTGTREINLADHLEVSENIDKKSENWLNLQTDMIDIGRICGAAVRAVYWLVMLVCNFLGYSPLWAQIAMKKKKLEYDRVRIPNHLAVLFTEKRLIKTKEIIEFLTSCCSLGIRNLSLYDPFDDLINRKSEMEIVCRNLHLDLIIDGNIISESYCSKMSVHLLSKNMGKPTLVEVCKILAEDKSPVTVEKIGHILETKYRLTDPEFLLQIGNVPSLCGYPPWSLRITEFLQYPRLPYSKCALDYCIEQFSQRDIRIGK
ncbi:unnamed protein product [Caenorhabditis angaria]|uniref:Ubiquitinyl hydrolase 1 n=1 Tax=Caenorhabditis angaria TaxID=860376 RepID=A0A9P1IC94_9PELO|nr:unnamed protein product [Caenorhabditis angaria]